MGNSEKTSRGVSPLHLVEPTSKTVLTRTAWHSIIDERLFFSFRQPPFREKLIGSREIALGTVCGPLANADLSTAWHPGAIDLTAFWGCHTG
ncbi:hypothetical protein AFLA_013702 [Aspergillus flavus NRRL3357]|nr:hypothetical protein AFLA_013702 [Aspergillus flavus NRRL3357]